LTKRKFVCHTSGQATPLVNYDRRGRYLSYPPSNACLVPFRLQLVFRSIYRLEGLIEVAQSVHLYSQDYNSSGTITTALVPEIVIQHALPLQKCTRTLARLGSSNACTRGPASTNQGRRLPLATRQCRLRVYGCGDVASGRYLPKQVCCKRTVDRMSRTRYNRSDHWTARD
jgi:hypothetical protein